MIAFVIWCEDGNVVCREANRLEIGDQHLGVVVRFSDTENCFFHKLRVVDISILVRCDYLKKRIRLASGPKKIRSKNIAL